MASFSSKLGFFVGRMSNLVYNSDSHSVVHLHTEFICNGKVDNFPCPLDSDHRHKPIRVKADAWFTEENRTLLHIGKYRQIATNL